MSSINATTNYDLFGLHEFNRDVINTETLEQSMKRHGWIDAYPMHVVKNGGRKLKIKDGHHRFEAARRLGIPVKYVVCDDSASLVDIIKTVQPWLPKDYLASYVRQGIPAYIAVGEYVAETGITLGHAISLLAGESAGSANKINAFKNGYYKLGNQEHAEQVKKIVLHMKKCGVKFATNSFLVQAISKAVWVDEFLVSRFCDKISSHAAHFEKQPNVQAYLLQIEAIYNRQRRSDKLPVAFLANEKSKERHMTFGGNNGRK
jgi:hypothetical protein